ncbi:hypothetical protein RFF05_15600 [Bengtsoniella intestinalis]|uniref:hypothetical protein n=1 Tax=Bengtsoniella intestinalis TaxID=3073143 RepID=UPI00391FBA5E
MSKAILSILSAHFGSKPLLSQEDYGLMDDCGVFLIPAVLHALQEIREFPHGMGTLPYLLLYHQYFHPDGTAMDSTQLLSRLATEGLDKCLDWDNQLKAGEQMLSALLFSSPYIRAMQAVSSKNDGDELALCYRKRFMAPNPPHQTEVN